MANSERTNDQAPEYSSTPIGDQQQSTQEKTNEAVEKAKARGEQVVDEAQSEGHQTASQTQKQGQQMADTVQQKADEQAKSAADTMNRTADTMREKSRQMPGGEKTKQFAGMAAGKMDQASSYLRQQNTGDMLKTVRDWTRAHPTASMVVVGLLGIFVGRKLFS
jgi:vacuolar-type H+-ATPase subunit H